MRIPGFKILNPLRDTDRIDSIDSEWRSLRGEGGALRSGSASMAVYKNIALRQLGDRQHAFLGHWAPMEHASPMVWWAIVFLHTDVNSWMM